jgi:hypothetical protein
MNPNGCSMASGWMRVQKFGSAGACGVARALPAGDAGGALAGAMPWHAASASTNAAVPQAPIRRLTMRAG